MINAVPMPLRIDRGAPRVTRIAVTGIDLEVSGTSWHAQIRLKPDAAGDPVLDLPKTSSGTTSGVRLAGVDRTDALPISYLDVQVAATVAFPAVGEPPAWDLFVTVPDVGTARWFAGPVLIAGTVTKESTPPPLVAIPLTGTSDYAAQFTAATFSLALKGAEYLAPLLARAETAADDAEASAATAAALVPSRSYANPGGQGDRRLSIVVTTSAGLLSEGSAANLVNGSAAANPTDSVAFAPVGNGRIRFDWGPTASKIVDEATFKQSGVEGHGVWRWQASQDLTTWVNIGNTFTLGGAAVQVQASLADNLTGYRAYQLVQVSGTTSGNPYVEEVEFKIASSSTDGYQIAPASPRPLAALCRGATAVDPAEWHSPILGGSSPAGLLGAWDFLTGVLGTKVIDGTGNGYDMTLSGSYLPTAKGTKLTGGLADTSAAIPGARLFAMLYRVPRGEGAVGYRQLLSAGNPAAGGATDGIYGQSVSPGWKFWIMTSQGLVPMIFDPVTGQSAYQLNRGGYALVFAEMPAAYDTRMGIGGPFGTTGNRASEVEVVLARAWGAAKTLSQMTTEVLAIRRQVLARGIYLHRDDCPRQYDVVLQWGQSDLTGYSCIFGWTGTYDARSSSNTFAHGIQSAPYTTGAVAAADLIAGDFTPNSYITHMGSNDGAWPMIEQFRFLYNHCDSSRFDKRYFMGPSLGTMIANEENRSLRQRPFLMVQSAINSTALAKWDLVTPSGATVRASSDTWNVAYSPDERSVWYSAMQHWADVDQHLLLQGIGPMLRAMWWWQGGEDGIHTWSAAPFQANLQALWDKSKIYLGVGSDFRMSLIKYEVGGLATGENLDGPATGASSAMEIMRTGHVNFAAANADVTLISIDDLPIQPDGHMYGSAQVTIGRRLYASSPMAGGS